MNSPRSIDLTAQISLDILNELGLAFPLVPTHLEFQQAVLETAFQLSQRSIRTLGQQPAAAEPATITSMAALACLGTAAYNTAPHLFTLAVLKMVRLSLDRGHTPLSAPAYGIYSALLSTGTLGVEIASDPETCYQLSHLAQALLNPIAIVAELNSFYHSQFADRLPTELVPNFGYQFISIFYFYDSLLQLQFVSEFEPISESEQGARLNYITANQAQLRAATQPSVGRESAQWYLIEAERYRLAGVEQSAIDCYDRAIQLATAVQCIPEQAFAHERTALFLLKTGNLAAARSHLHHAEQHYAQWGSIANLKALKRYSAWLAFDWTVEACHPQHRLELEQQLLHYTTRLKAIDQEFAALCYAISHDLRAPLRHIQGFIHALQQRLIQVDGLHDSKVAHYLNILETSGQKMGQLMDGVLTLSRISRQELVIRTVNLRSIVAVAVDAILASRSSENQPSFHVGDLPIVRGDVDLLRQTFAYLLDNAVKFSRSQPMATIEIGSLPDAILFVKDNGVGFSMQHAEQLFGMFQKLHCHRTYEGIGVGLAIVQRIIHRHNGTIWAESQPGQGATFYFKLGDLP